MSNIISCAQYDYFEIACMHHYEILLTLKDGSKLQGIAHNVKVAKDGETRKEVLELILANKEVIVVELMTIHKIQAVTVNPHFRVFVLTNS
ncbi:MAG: Rho-binding antiterminator [Oceanicoccus sp.]|jgi:Rho-binding antiterminator